MRRAKRALVGAAAVAVLGGAGFFGYMQLVKAGVLKYNRFDRRERGSLLHGAPAPDLPLTLYDGRTARLSSFWTERPLFLVFGSCT